MTAHAFSPANPSASANAYLRSKVMTASPAELRLMLLDGAIKFARQGREGIERRDYERMFNGLSQCRDIVTELIVSVRDQGDHDLAEKVRGLYAFIYSQLLEASLSKSIAHCDQAIERLEYERQTWAMLMKKLADERGAEVHPPMRADQSA
ncbi:MAG: flagellar export chaperone FliS [Phycisphaeraceae bacterium]|mgnify:CR=1 FL=1|nr:flagellar export chaperone FliS [Phycisphaerae bacterium]MBX3392958.1 flagellar export chaperone FliS [Phycisphaeraceae bacterium]